MLRERYLSLIGLIAFIITATVGGWLVNTAFTDSPVDPIIMFRYPVVMPTNGLVCPGDTLIYRQEMQVRYTPATVRVSTTIWSPGDERTVWPEDDPRYLNYPAPVVVRVTNTYLVPALMHGRYELRISAAGEGHKTSIYTVPFEIKDGC